MKNFVQDGSVVEFTAPYARLSGEAAKQGNLFGVATNDVANGATGSFKTNGVFDVTALTTDVAAQGAVLYWDDTNRRLTVTVGSNTRVGVALVAKTNGQTTARVLLDGRI